MISARNILLLLITCAAAGGLLQGQATEGSILGIITDPLGSVVPGAQVTLIGDDTGLARTIQTNSTGEYVFAALPLGRYSIRVEHPGFKKGVFPGIVITVKARVRADVHLQVGETSESVSVAAEAPLLKSETIEVANLVTRSQLQNLPVLSRHFLNLSILTPNTVRLPTGRQADLGGDSFALGTAAADQNNFIIEGISNNMEFSGTIGVVPAMDAIQEVSFQTSGYSAEFGKGGGAIVNVAMRSGTNQLHGFAYDYLRNDILNARPYDFTGTNPAKQPLRRNQFGAGVSMPIIRNKLFVFGNYEGLRQPATILSYNRVPLPAERRGDFSQSNFLIYDPLTQRPDPANPSRIVRSQFPGNRIPVDRQNAMMLDLVSRLPDPNFVDPSPNVFNNFLAFQRNNDTLDSYNVKGDWLARANDTLTLRYTQQGINRSRQGFMPDDLNSGRGDLDATNAGVNHTHVFTPRLLNEFRTGYNYLVFGNTLVNDSMFTDKYNIPGANVQPGFPNFNIRNIARPAPIRALSTLPNPFGIVQHSLQFMDNMTWQAGHHTIKFGGEFSNHRNDTSSLPPGGIEPIFQADYTTPFVGATREAARTGLGDALLGLASQWTTYYYPDATRLRLNRYALFIQDEYRARPNLNLTLGLRYEVNPKWGERDDRLTGFDQNLGKILVPESGRQSLIDLGIPNGDLPSTFLYVPRDRVIPKTDFMNFGPRLGAAYTIRPRIVLRGGWGIFFGNEQANYNNNTSGVPFSSRLRFNGSQDTPIRINDGFPSGSYNAVVRAPFPTISQMIELDHPDGFINKFNFNVQVQPFARTAVEVGYHGFIATNFPTATRFNHPSPGPGDQQARRPYPEFGEGFGLFYIGDSNYNSLEITVRQQEVHGFSFQSSFTWSKGLGYVPDNGIMPERLDYYYGRMTNDYRRRWVTSFLYRIPSLAGRNAWAKPFLAGWQTSGIIQYQGGLPFSILSSQNMNDGLNASRADLITTAGPAELSGSERNINRFFNTAAFVNPPNFVFGNSGVNILNGPGIAQWDLALQKLFPVREGMTVQFRGEASNVFNRVNLGQPSSTIGGSAYGAIRSTSTDPRNLQVSLRLQF
jgi:hypothetical protein